ncbi:MAG: type II secretion system secretin GspD, partial [Deltaproteobacteria bacterium]|nr:type II secretion system secretin GspD [Deltaproteobacteria bacterium]
MKGKQLLVLGLGLCLAGCASGPPPAALLPPRPQVRVMDAPVIPPSEAQALLKKKSEVKKEPETDIIEARGAEVLATALKALPTRRRRPPRGEEVFPIELNLQNADLVEAVRALADTLKLNYTIDPKVKGTANVRASGKLTRSELMSILETMLLVNGAALVKVGKTYNIVPLDKAAGQAAPVYARGLPAAGMTAQVVFLTQTPAKEVTAVLKPLLSPGGKIGRAPNNSVVIVDYPANVEKLVNLIQLIDTQAMARTSVSVIKVKNTDPASIIADLDAIFSAYGALRPKDKGAGGVQFLSIPRMNAVMILAGSRALLDRAKFWVRQLDLKTDALANVHVYHVKNYKARNLADLLTQAYGGAPAAPPGVEEVRPESAAGGITTPGGGFVPTGRAAGRLGQKEWELGPSSRERGRPGRPGGEGELALAAPPARERALPLAGAPAAAPLKEGVRIIPDEENNLLVIVAPPYEWNVISRLLEKLDVMPRQVLCEVLIADVTLTDDLRYGIEWFINTRQTNPDGTPQTIVTPPGFSNAPNPFGLEILRGASAALQGLGGFTFLARDTLNKFKVTLNMLAAEGKVEVLASPHIMAANNQEARIQIGQDVPILVASSTGILVAEQTVVTNQVEYRSTGIILKVRPQINAKGLITLEIVQEVSNVASQAVGTVTNSPTFDVRQAKTQLITRDNQTIVLGGLIREDVARGATGVPGLRRLPLLGPLFGSESSRKRRTELIV